VLGRKPEFFVQLLLMKNITAGILEYFEDQILILTQNRAKKAVLFQQQVSCLTKNPGFVHQLINQEIIQIFYRGV
jgi:hypothetical protein